ncbi:hypothetical protein P7C71_g794, partial [Lecanoromycetidae sp. Uapishka_2]
MPGIYRIVHVNEAIGGDVEMLDGYEDVDAGIQAKIRKSLEEGHVPDEDWNGDVEMNRPGMNGFRTPASKKAKKEEQKVSRHPSTSRLVFRARSNKVSKAAKDGEEDGSASPSEAQAGKKRRRVKDEPEVKAEMNGHSAKKTKAVPKKVKATKVKEEDADNENGDEEVSVRSGREKGIKMEEDDTDINFESNAKPVQKARGKGMKATEQDVGGESTHSARPVKKGPGKARMTEEDKVNDEVEAGNAPTKKGRGKVKAKKAAADAEADAEGKEKDMSQPKNGRKKSAKQTEDDGEDLTKDAEEEVPKPKKGRKKTSETSTNVEMPTRSSGRGVRKNYTEAD